MFERDRRQFLHKMYELLLIPLKHEIFTTLVSSRKSGVAEPERVNQVMEKVFFPRTLLVRKSSSVEQLLAKTP
jgi:hypothetical protein